MTSRHTKRFFEYDTWKVCEVIYKPELNRFFETIFFLGNGYMGVRGVPEEGAAPEQSNPYTFVGSIYDTFPVNTWRTEISGGISMVNAPNWYHINLYLGRERFDPRTGTVLEYCRVLDMQQGTVTRTVVWESVSKKKVQIRSIRFVSMDNLHQAAIRYSITPINFAGAVRIECGIDGAGAANLLPKKLAGQGKSGACCSMRTKETGFELVTMMETVLKDSKTDLPYGSSLDIHERSVYRTYTFSAEKGTTYSLDKLIAVCTSRDNTFGSPYARAFCRNTPAPGRLSGTAMIFVSKEIRHPSRESVSVS
jgi:alpha,alpha-trehalose phosphorylase